MKTSNAIRATALALAIAAASGVAVAQSGTDALYVAHVTPDGLIFEPTVGESLSAGIELVIAGPGNFRLERRFAPGELTEFRPGGKSGPVLPDGRYNYELVVRSIAGVQRSRSGPQAAEIESLYGGGGSFTVVDGRIADPALVESSTAGPGTSESVTSADSGPPASIAKFGEATEQVISGDLTVYNSLCVGNDCASAESFGFDTIRMKENNTRLHFFDTSNSGSFPTNDWRLTANDSSNGGANRFSIDDVDGGRMPFAIEAGARSNSLYIDSGDRIGFGTSTPSVQLHQRDGNTPTLRLDQDGSSGFTSQVWDIAGNEANFFIRDVTNGSNLSFRIKPGAPQDSLSIAADGDIGMGTDTPDAALHVEGASAGILAENTSATAAQRTMLDLSNNGKTRIIMRNLQASSDWTIDNSGTTLDFSRGGTGVAEFKLEEDGDAVFIGDVTANGVVLSSSRTVKTQIEPVDGDALLDKVMSLQVHSWRYRESNPGVSHIGPMAEDFHALFGIGDERHINVIDTTGITFAALQAVAKRYEGEIETLASELTEQERKVEDLERKLEQLAHRLDRSLER